MRSVLFRLDPGLDDGRAGVRDEPVSCSGWRSLELRREDDGRAWATSLVSKSRLATLAKAAAFDTGGVSCDVDLELGRWPWDE